MNSDILRYFFLPTSITGVLVVVICVFALCGVHTSIADTIMILGASFGLSHLMRFAYLLGRAQGKREVVESVPKIQKDKPVKVNPMSSENVQRRQQACDPCEDFC